MRMRMPNLNYYEDTDAVVEDGLSLDEDAEVRQHPQLLQQASMIMRTPILNY